MSETFCQCDHTCVRLTNLFFNLFIGDRMTWPKNAFCYCILPFKWEK